MKLFRHWFQNLKREGRHLFHFRGSIYYGEKHKRAIGYEVCSGPALSFEITHGEAGYDSYSTCLSLGLIFVKIYLTFPLPKWTYETKKCIATWDNNKEFYLVQGRRYGFYWYDWTFWWSFRSKIHESSSSDPKWMRFNFCIPDFLFGRVEVISNEVLSAENVKFKLSGKEFVMNKIIWERRRLLRRHIPMSLYSQEWYSVNMEIDNPPMRSGKGENSWDCGNDGTYGLSASWKFNKPKWDNVAESKKLAVAYYVEGVLKDAKKYGSGSGDLGIKSSDVFEYVG